MKKRLTTAIATLALALPVMLPSVTFAASNCNNGIQQGIANGINDVTTSNPQPSGASCASGADIQGGIVNTAQVVVNILSLVVGIIAVIMIIYAGFRYISSGGSSDGVSSAKNSLIYAIVGLIIVALAQIIVRWVLNTSQKIGGDLVLSHLHLLF